MRVSLCIVTRNRAVGDGWLRSMKECFEKEDDLTAVVGENRNYYQGNPYACVVSLYNEVWLRKRVDGGTGEIFDYAVLDNKNIAYRLKDLREED